MKVILLTHFSNGKPPISLDLCQTKYHVYAYLLYKHLSQKNDIEIEFDRLPQKGKSVINNYSLSGYKIKKGDHAIIIDKNGFYKRPTKFKNKLKEYIRGSLTSIGISTVYYGGEDMLFFLDNVSNLRHNSSCIDWLCDDAELYPDKMPGIIKILIQKPENDSHDSEVYYLEMLEKIKKFVRVNENTIETEVGILGNNFYKDLLTEEVIHLDNYEKKYELIRATDIYFVTTNSFDREKLIEFGMSNTLIVSKKNYINPRVRPYLDTVEIKKTIPWGEVIEALNNVKSRQKLLNSELCIKQSIDRIYDYFASYDIVQYRDREKVKVDNQVESNKYLEILQKYNNSAAPNNNRAINPIPNDQTKRKKKYLMIMPEKYKKKQKPSNKSKKKKVTVEREPKPFRMIQSRYGFK